MSLSIFYSYSHKDELHRESLESHLAILKRQGFITDWHDRRIAPGDNWENQIDLNIDKSDIILLLISSDFLASDYCYETETIRALERENKKEAIVIPIIVKPCLWKESHFAHLQVLPKDGLAITLWPNQDEAWFEVAKALLSEVKSIKQKTQDGEVVIGAITEFKNKLGPKNDDIKKLILRFLNEYNKWYFSPLRIKEWGSLQDGFGELGHYSLQTIKEGVIELLKEHKLKTTSSQKGNPIYRIN